MNVLTEQKIESAQSALKGGDLQRGLELYNEAYRDSVKLGLMTDAMVCCRDMAAIYDNIGKYQEAVEVCALGLKEAQLDTISYAGLCVNKGTVLIKLYRFSEALESFEGAISRIGLVPAKLRTEEMRYLRDMSIDGRDLLKQVLKAQAEGKTIGIEIDK